jgi:hypothetical protein
MFLCGNLADRNHAAGKKFATLGTTSFRIDNRSRSEQRQHWSWKDRVAVELRPHRADDIVPTGAAARAAL